MQEKCEEFATRVVKLVPQDDHRYAILSLSISIWPLSYFSHLCWTWCSTTYSSLTFKYWTAWRNNHSRQFFTNICLSVSLLFNCPIWSASPFPSSASGTTYVYYHLPFVPYHMPFISSHLPSITSYLSFISPVASPSYNLPSYDLLLLCRRELLSAMLEEVSSEYVLLAVHGIGYLARYLHQHQYTIISIIISIPSMFWKLEQMT